MRLHGLVPTVSVLRVRAFLLTTLLLVSVAASGQTVSDSKPKIPAKYDVTRIGERGIGKGVNFYSLDKEMMLGRELSHDVESSAKMFTDPVVNEFVNRLGQRLARNSDTQVPLTVKIIDSDEINAFALPGGFLYVNTGLILAADSESELAGVMSHEIAHIAARHATRNLTKGELWNLASIPLVFVGGAAGYAIQQAAGIAVPMSILKFSRDAEREADLLGMQYEYASGYDPSSFVGFFEKLNAKEKKHKGFLSKAFSTHPMTDDRIKRAQDEMETMLPDREQYVVDTSEFQEVKARLASMLNGRRLVDITKNPNRPVLRKAEDSRGPGSNPGAGGDEDRPTLKRPTPDQQ